MIYDFRVSGFRHFDDVHIKKIKRVNLFVGKNSAGKSALLEALLLFFSQMSIKYLPAIHLSRHEWDNRSIQDDPSPFRHLFKGHKLPSLGEVGIRFESDGDSRSFELLVLPYVRNYDPAGPLVSSYSIAPLNDDEIDPDSIVNFLVIKKGEDFSRIIQLNMTQRELERRASRNLFLGRGEICNFIPTNGLSEYETASLWDNISLTSFEFEVIRGLKLIEPKVEALAFVGGESVRERIPLVKISGVAEPMPLKGLGDGMRKIFQLILALANSKNGVLLIDEFENGLHWSVQQEVWELVFELSKSLNVQVFATTHSRDCIKGFEYAWSKDSESGGFNRINKTDGSVLCREYSLELLQDSLETDVEVR